MIVITALVLRYKETFFFLRTKPLLHRCRTLLPCVEVCQNLQHPMLTIISWIVSSSHHEWCWLTIVAYPLITIDRFALVKKNVVCG